MNDSELCARAICHEPLTCPGDCAKCEPHGAAVTPSVLCADCLAEINREQAVILWRELVLRGVWS